MDSPVGDLVGALARLDILLESAVAATKLCGEPGAAGPFRGLYIAADEAAGILRRAPGVPRFCGGRDESESLIGAAVESPPFASLAKTFNLTSFDLDVIVVALAPELDLRYERVYGYLQDDVTRRRPSVDLALNLLASTAEEKLSRRAHFAIEAPLIRQGLVHLVPDPNHVHPPLLAHYLKLDEQVVRLLAGEPGMDRRLENYCRLLRPNATTTRLEQLPLDRETQDGLRSLIRRARESRQPLKLHFSGRRGSGKLRAAQALAGEIGLALLVADLNRWPDGGTEFESTLRVAFREPCWMDAVLYLDGVDLLRSSDRTSQFSRLMDAVAAHSGIVIMAGTDAWASDDGETSQVIGVAFPVPEFALRHAHWQASLAANSVSLSGQGLDALASRFRLTPGQIEEAVCWARNRAIWRAASQSRKTEIKDPTVAKATLADLFAGARAQCGHELAKLARKIEAKQSWDDIVLPPDQLSQLREVCDQARYRHLVFGEWGFGRKLSLGKGLNALFAGPPGTGKTMAAEVIAGELQLDLYKIDLSQVVSKYIGETEKNLDRIFTAAETANAILFFDEADALFGKRSEVKDSHDRYANIEIGYLLQKMEEYEGVAILATNLRQNLDEAFARRMHSIVEFPFPDEEQRRRIWEVTFPREAPLGEDVEFSVLAREIKLAGGNIRNIALGAAFYAAADGQVINLTHLARAARREHQKLGRAWSESSLQAADRPAQ